jgi:hypothetical protein
MRLTHLNDRELQAYADRHHLANEPWLSQDQAADHLEQHEHVCTCSACRESLAQYESLYGELAASDDCQPSLLPRNFARKVTLSIPPFAAAHARATIRLWAGAGSAVALLFAWWLCTLNWSVIIGKAAASVMVVGGTVHGWLLSAVARVCLDGLVLANQWMPRVDIDWSRMVLVLSRLVADPLVFTFVVCAGLAAYLMTSVDDLILTEYIRHRDR